MCREMATGGGHDQVWNPAMKDVEQSLWPIIDQQMNCTWWAALERTYVLDDCVGMGSRSTFSIRIDHQDPVPMGAALQGRPGSKGPTPHADHDAHAIAARDV